MGTTRLEDAIPDTGSNYYYEQGFRKVIEDNLAILRNSPYTQSLSLKPYHASLYKNQLYSLLTEYKIPVYLHWIMMRLNGMSHPNEYEGVEILYIPDFKMVENLLNTYRSRYKAVV